MQSEQKIETRPLARTKNRALIVVSALMTLVASIIAISLARPAYFQELVDWQLNGHFQFQDGPLPTAADRVHHLSFLDFILNPDLIRLRLKASWDFYKVTGIPPKHGQCLHKRAIFEDLMTDQECQQVRDLFRFRSSSSDTFENDPGHIDIHDLERNALEHFQNNTEYLKSWDIYRSAQQKLLSIARTYFQNPRIHPEMTHLTNRVRGAPDMSDVIHSDKCAYDLKTGICTLTEEHCCAWTDFSAVLYLNGPGMNDWFKWLIFLIQYLDEGLNGGNFVYIKPPFAVDENDGCAFGRNADDERLSVTPKCGRAVLFSSGEENLHQVEVVESEVAQNTLALWMTTDSTHWEQNASN